MNAADRGARRWAISLAVTAVAVAAGWWLWFGPWLWQGIPWLVMAALPFLVGLAAPKLPLLFGLLPFVIPYVAEGDVHAASLMFGVGACYVAIAFGVLVRRLAGGVFPGDP